MRRIEIFMPGLKINTEIMLYALLLLAYLLGSIPWGLIFARVFAGDDIRLKGSRNIGATNVIRETGVIPGLLTLAGDFLKGAFPVYLALLAFGPAGGFNDAYLLFIVLAAFSGHLFPIYLKFRDGGKGVATAAGCFAVVSPAAVLTALIVFVAVLMAVRRVSAGSLSAAATLPVAVWLAVDAPIMTFAAVIVALFIFIRHRSNLKRLVAGTEPEFRLRKGPSSK
jgi:glycerol-3-phosphate acyltransferase PlsY